MLLFVRLYFTIMRNANFRRMHLTKAAGGFLVEKHHLDQHRHIICNCFQPTEKLPPCNSAEKSLTSFAKYFWSPSSLFWVN